ncbi:PepSY-associated TM helix domain-containing protein [Janthinobacterium sp. SUN118]|uniref:PepSY-associated TM helix domain-containing protein n=1 Tax=Janthinobacterium sp. SUN118 TaxID=3004100 RepID=UPI0025AF4244|nr:PepSY-associated TM helix domain-containing protein [Janthinobacterium sp. SUN118]MDN2711604.1 PepSY-associated TM helix domain-containing protein [Janthinobacterium sp. SUN118]
MNQTTSLLARRKSLYWRIHFWAALIASPFALLATLTGILYVFTPQVEDRLYAHLEHVAPQGAMRPLDAAVAAAETAAPRGWAVQHVVPPFHLDDTVQVAFAPPGGAPDEHAGHGMPAKARPAFGLPAQAVIVYVNPYDASVLGTLASSERFGNWAKKLHSRLLQGDGWRWMIELAASWLVVMLATGVVLWWPRGAQTGLPRKGATGRNGWRQWHAFLGVALGLVSVVILATGLTWSQQAGGRIRVLRDISGQAPPPVPRGLHSREDGAPLDWQDAWQVARSHAPAIALQLTAPASQEDVWRATMADRSRPTLRFDLQFDAYSGKPLYYAGWDAQTAFGKATAIGIPFHRGEFGWWNQALLLLFGASVLFSLVSGWVMFFKRRAPGSLGLPKLLPGAWTSPSPLAWLAAAGMCALMPLLLVSGSLLMLLELILAQASRRRWAGR